MRKIEKAMLQAIKTRTNWKSGNTEVKYFPYICEPMLSRIESAKVYLHGNHIVTCVYGHTGASGPMVCNKDTFTLFPTRTTCSRLRALGIGAHIKQGNPYIDNVRVRGN